MVQICCNQLFCNMFTCIYFNSKYATFAWKADACQMCVEVQGLPWQQMRGKFYENVMFTSHLHVNSTGAND